MSSIEIRPIGPNDHAAVDALTVRFWGETRVVDIGGAIETCGLPGALALRDGAFAGAVTWLRVGDALKLATIASLYEGIGIGRALVVGAEAEARRLGLARVVLSTTNDNLRALAFYQRAGFVLAALHRDAVDRLRALKPAIPAVAGNGIPIRDQIDLEKHLR